MFGSTSGSFVKICAQLHTRANCWQSLLDSRKLSWRMNQAHGCGQVSCMQMLTSLTNGIMCRRRFSIFSFSRYLILAWLLKCYCLEETWGMGQGSIQQRILSISKIAQSLDMVAGASGISSNSSWSDSESRGRDIQCFWLSRTCESSHDERLARLLCGAYILLRQHD